MYVMKRNILLIFFVVVAMFEVAAQNLRNNISVELMGGLSPFTYKNNIGDRRGMPGTSAAIKYQYHFNWNWSLGVGAEIKMYQSSSRFDSFSDSYNTYANSLISGKADEMIFSYSYKNLEERQRALYFNIPIFAQYRFNSGFYIRLGAKVGIPVKSGSELYFEELKTQGYFPHENVTYTDMPQHGFGTYYNSEIDEDYKLKVNTTLTAEIGWSWDWNEQNILYLGFHGEYGFSNLYDRGELVPQLQYDGGNLNYTPIWGADVNVGDKRTAITNDNIRTFAIGLLIRYSFGF